MKGVNLITMTIVIIVLGIVVLLIGMLISGSSKGTADIIMIREGLLKPCCTDRSIWDCVSDTSSVYCKVPWDPGKITLKDLANEAGITSDELSKFCNCE